LAPANTNEVKV